MSYILDSSSSLERRRRERARLDLLDEVSGAWVRRVLTQCGVAAGWHCLDVGAGAGHLARWMASEVGPEGRVVATDTDPYFLDDVAGVEVRQHDILDGVVEADSFDLVVARAVLVHIADRERALRYMAAALRPGGWLVVVDPTLPTTPRLLRAADDDLHGRVWHLWSDFVVEAGAGWDAAHAVLIAEALGLSAEAEGLVHVLAGGESPARLWAGTVAASARPLVERGTLSASDLERFVALMDDPGYRATQLFGYATWARRDG